MIDPHAHATHVTPYDRLAWTDIAVEPLLASGSHREELTAYFGADSYRELAALAVRVAAAPAPNRSRVYILPGIMGSQLAVPRSGGLPADVLWLDPLDIGAGRLRELALPGNASFKATTVLLFSYLKMKLTLRLAGFDPVLHHYDWRLSLVDLGRELVERLARERTPVAIVAHSMGGLVARAALAALPRETVSQLIMLGTPNQGAFAPVQALRGTYAVVRKVASLDREHSAERLARDVFASFPSLYEMMPTASKGNRDLCDRSSWPRRGRLPESRRLRAARRVQRALAPGDARMATIVGVGFDTVTDTTLERDQFVYTITRRGDGTVPADRACLRGARTYFATAGHSDLPRSDVVIAATEELLHMGETALLARTVPRLPRVAGQVSDAELRRTHRLKVDWTSLSQDERRQFLENLNDPPRVKLHPLSRKAHRYHRG